MWWAQGDALPIVELAPVKSLMGLARPWSAGAAADMRAPVAEEIPQLLQFLDDAMNAIDAGDAWLRMSS